MADRIPVWGDPSTNPGKVREFETGDNMVLPGGLKLQGGSVPVDPSTTPAPGSVPVSRPDGTLDSRWMPGLVAGLNRSAISQAVHLTAAASGSSGIRVAASEHYAPGNTDWGVVASIALPDYTPSDAQVVWMLYEGADNFVRCEINTDGKPRLQVVIGGVEYLSLTDTAATEAIDTPDGSSISLGVWIMRETETAAGSIRWDVNGHQVGDAIVIPAGVPPAFPAGPAFILGNSALRTEGITSGFRFFNYAKSPAEILDLYLNGVAYADRGASQTDVIAGWDFESGWSTSASASITSASAFEVSGAGGLRRSDTLIPGKRHRIVASGVITGSSSMEFRQVNNSSFTDPGTVAHVISGSGGFNVEFEFIAEASALYLRLGSAGSVEFSTLTVTQIGTTLDLEPEGINHTQIHDSSGNGNHAPLPESGASLVRPQYDGDIRWRHEWKGTQEIQYLGGVNQAIIASEAALRGYIDIIASDPVTIDIGDGADQDRYAAAAELVAGRNRVELLTPFHDGTNRKLTVKPDADYSGTLAITAPYEILEVIA